MKIKRILSLVSVLLLTVLLLASCGNAKGAGVGPACTGYYATDLKGENTLFWEEQNSYTMPSEFVKMFAYFTASDLTEEQNQSLAYRFLYDYDVIYMKSLLEKAGVTPETLVIKMNEKAKSLGLLSTRFESVTGFKSEEEDLYKSYYKDHEQEKEPDPSKETEGKEFQASVTNLKDLSEMAKIFHQDEQMNAILRESTHQFKGQDAPKARPAPLIRFDSNQFTEEAVIYLAGYGINNKDQTVYIAIASVSDKGKESFSAVSEYSGNDKPYSFASADAGNLCGKVISENYGLSSSLDGKVPEQGTLVVGANLFYVFAFLFIALLVILLGLIIVLGVVVVTKRNKEGRKKYRNPKDKELSDVEQENIEKEELEKGQENEEQKEEHEESAKSSESSEPKEN